MSESTADRNPVELLAEEFAARLRRGEHPSLTEYVERTPNMPTTSAICFPLWRWLRSFKPAPQELMARWPLHHRQLATSFRRSWETTVSSATSVKEEWEWFMRRFASRLAVTWRSK